MWLHSKKKNIQHNKSQYNNKCLIQLISKYQQQRQVLLSQHYCIDLKKKKISKFNIILCH